MNKQVTILCLCAAIKHGHRFITILYVGWDSYIFLLMLSSLIQIIFIQTHVIKKMKGEMNKKKVITSNSMK